MPTPPSRVFPAVLTLAFVGALVFGLLRFDGPARGYWDTYITAPAMFMNKVPVSFVLKDGSAAFDPQLAGVLPDDLVDEDDFGIITKDQRLGGGISASVPFAFFGIFGLRLLFALAAALMIPLTVLCVRQLGEGHDWAGLVGGVALALNPYMVSILRLNANLFSMPLMLLLLFLLLRRGTPAVLIGLAFGILAGIRNEAVCFVPAVSLWVLLEDREVPFGRRFLRLVVVGACTVLALGPILYWKWYAFGNPLMHPSQYAHFQGFRPEFAHSLFGLEFTFNGLFNWPLHSELVRTPHFAFPTYLLFPLVTIRGLGLVMSAFAVYGAVLLLKRQPLVGATLALWMAPVYVLFGPQENWEEVKMTFMLLAWPPLGIYMAEGVGHVIGKVGERTPWIGRSGVVIGIAVLLFAVVQLSALVQVPQDMRWYVRFPNADKVKNPEAQEGLAPEERNEWRYFQSYETEGEILRERKKLTAALPWPAPYLPLGFDPEREWAEMQAEVGHKALTVLEIWGYIYGTRR